MSTIGRKPDDPFIPLTDEEISEIPIKIRVNIALRKIKHQFIDVPEGRLMYAVVDQAIRDLFFAEKDDDQRSAVKYLSGRIPQAFASGVNSEWIKDLLKKLQLLGHQND